MTDETDGWTYWRNGLKGIIEPKPRATPQWGFYKTGRNNQPVAIYPDPETGALWVRIGEDFISDADPLAQETVWGKCAKNFVSRPHYATRMKTGMWPGLPAEMTTETKPSGPGAGPGDNSGSLTEFAAMQADITNAVEAAKKLEAAWTAKPADERTQDDANLATDAGNRLGELKRTADKKRLAATEDLRRQIETINGQWNEIISAANRQSIEMHALADDWSRAEQEKRRKAAQALADAEHQKRLDELAKQAVEALAKGEPEATLFQEPPPQPVVASVPKVVTGSGNYGHRRSPKAPTPTATIVDLKAAALHYAETGAPDLIEAIQKCANRAVKARAKVPGIRFSWEGETTEASP